MKPKASYKHRDYDFESFLRAEGIYKDIQLHGSNPAPINRWLQMLSFLKKAERSLLIQKQPRPGDLLKHEGCLHFLIGRGNFIQAVLLRSPQTTQQKKRLREVKACCAQLEGSLREWHGQS